MIQIGIIINFVLIVVGSLFGKIIGNKFDEKLKKIIMETISLFIIMIGVKSVVKADVNVIKVIIFLMIGVIIGHYIDIQKKIAGLSNILESKFAGSGDSKFKKGFITSTILYCAGAMAIVGSIKSALDGENDILIVKSIIDGITSVILTSLYGIGVLFSAFSVLIYQGVFFLGALFLKSIINDPTVIREIDYIGGILIVGLGINVLFNRKLQIENMIPAVFMPIIYFVIKKSFL